METDSPAVTPPTVLRVPLLGRNHAVTLPGFAEREELIVCYGEAYNRKGVTLARAYSALVGLTTRLGKESGVDYAACRFDALDYGGKVYAWLRKQGATATQIQEAAIPIANALIDALPPRENEVADKADFIEGEGG